MIESSNVECISPIHSPPSSIFNSKSTNLHPPSSYLKSLLSNRNSSSLTLLFPSAVKSMRYLAKKVIKIAGSLTKCPQAPLAAFYRSAVVITDHVEKSFFLNLKKLADLQRFMFKGKTHSCPRPLVQKGL